MLCYFLFFFIVSSILSFLLWSSNLEEQSIIIIIIGITFWVPILIFTPSSGIGGLYLDILFNIYPDNKLTSAMFLTIEEFILRVNMVIYFIILFLIIYYILKFYDKFFIIGKKETGKVADKDTQK